MNFLIALLVGAIVSRMGLSLQLREGASTQSAAVLQPIADKFSNFIDYINSIVSAAPIRSDSPAAAMTLVLMTQFHLEGMKASAENDGPVKPLIGAHAVRPGDPQSAPTSYLKKKLFVARNACDKGALMSYGESVGLNICYPASANLTVWTIFSTNGSAVISSNYATSDCSGAPISSSAQNIGCDPNAFYTLGVSSKKGWGSSVGFGVDVFTTTSGCKNNNGVSTGNVFIATSPTGCYSSTNNTSNGVSCTGNKFNYLTYKQLSCQGKYTTESMTKTSKCGNEGMYGYAYGYPYFKCYNL